MRKEFFVDIETNDSLDSKTGKITQIAFIYRKNGRVITKTDITRDIYPSLIDSLDQIVNKFDKKDKLYFIAYNANFDNEFIRRLFDQNANKFFGSYFYTPAIDVMQFAAIKFLKKNIRPENYKLSTVCEFLGLKVNESKLHNAVYDIELTKQLYNTLSKL